MFSNVGIVAVTMSIIFALSSGDTVKVNEAVEEYSNTTSVETIIEEPVQWWTDDEEYLLAQLVMAEGGSDDISDECQQLIAVVVLNRSNHPAFADGIENVIFQKGQYACSSYVRSVEPNQRVVKNVRAVLSNEVTYPDDIVWQSGEPQCAWGTDVEIYKVFDTKPYKTYFCHYGQ